MLRTEPLDLDFTYILSARNCMVINTYHPEQVTGPNACGKTSFFRCLGGLWPLRAGKVTIRGSDDSTQEGDDTAQHGADSIFLVPQRIYCCLGTLADQVTYPQAIPSTARDTETTERILQLLELVGTTFVYKSIH